MMKKYVSLKLALLCMVGFLCFNVNGFGQGISCATATPLTINGACGGAAVISDNSQDAPNLVNNGCNIGTFRHEGWYTFTVSGGSKNVTIEANAANRNLFLQLISSTGACAGLAQIGCTNFTDTNNVVQTETITATLANGIYYVKVVNVGGTSTMNLSSICVTSVPTACQGTTTNFYDSGGAAGNYGNNENLTWTFYPNGGPVTATFTAFNLEATYDFLRVYNGPNASSPLLGIFSGNTIPGPFTSTHASQALTFVFTSDGSGTPAGWAATVCGTPPPPPSNDDPCSAQTLTVNASCTYATYTNQFATNTTGLTDPGCASYAGGDVWFSVTVPASGNILIDTQTGVITDSGMAVYTGTCGGLTLLECDDDDSANGLMSSITRTGLTPGSTLFIRFWEFGNDNNGTFGICATEPPPPPTNDNPCGAVALTVNPDRNCGTVTSGSVTNATNSGINPCFGTADDDVWFKFVATATTHFIDILNVSGSVTDMYHALYGPYTPPNCTVAAGSNLLCSDPNNSSVSGLVVGATYYLQVYTYTSTGGQNSSFNICIGTPPPPPANDLCSGAISLPCGTLNLPGTTVSSSSVANISGCTMSTYGVWYTFAGDGNASTISSTSAAGFDHEMSISTGNCVNQTNIACVDGPGGGGTETFTFNTTLGVQYYVYVAYFSDFGTSTDTGSFTISRTCSPPSYCIPSSTDTTYFIRDFRTTGGTASNINHTNSGFSAGGYGNFTAIHNVTQAPSGVINFNAVFRRAADTFETNIWVDWNNDFDFDDPNEKVYASAAYANPQAGSFTVLGSAAPGSYRMRVRAAYFTSDPLPCGYDDPSETHDYTLIVTPLNCTANPINLIATATSATTATIGWTAPAPPPGNGYGYAVSTSPTGTPVVASGTTAGTTVNITGLNAGTTYYIFVRGECNATDQGYWVTATLTTSCTNVVTTPTICPIIVDVQGNNPFTANPFIADPTATIDCTNNNVTLVANSNLRATTSYIVEQTTYPSTPPDYNFPALGGGQAITSDDVWASARTNLGFNFCFYGATYTQTLVGANGMITFDTANTPGSSCGYAFSNNLPSRANALFEQTIYGVYHDIDPRNLVGTPIKSRTIGTVGCRQFQVAWNDIPMFGDATRLYTGMIVLHETTNIIEVFIKEKRIENGNVNPWNGGNALVGVQGDITPLAPNNQALAAPCRNSLDTNWETTNEAWRFTPNGAVINPTSVTWYQGSVAPANIIATTPTVNVTAGNTYFASVSYTLCSGPVTLVDEIVVTDTKKVWNGSVSTNWYLNANWTPSGVPTINDCVIIPATTTTANRSPIADTFIASATIPIPPSIIARAKNVLVQNNGSLEIKAATFLEIDGALTVQPSGDVLIRDTGSLIQVTDVTTNNNTGNIRMERTVPGGVASANYVYWSSPVEGFDVGNINTAASELKFLWNPTQGGLNGTYVAASGAMTVGRGYIVRGLATPPSPIPASTAQFVGRPSNGIINTPISRGTYTGGPYTAVGGGTAMATNIDDNWNLVGNPYPSAISASAFIAENIAETPKIDGTIYLWNHTGLPTGTTTQDPFYGNYVYNYLGSSYVATNGVGSNPSVFFGSIAAGQSFFVQMLDGAGVSNTVNFNNSMRSGSPANNNFLRTGERHRIWLDLINSNDDAISTLIGYVPDATNDRDLLFDGYDLNDTSIQLYSLIGEEEMTIQGRALPLDQEDRVPLGIVVPQNATYKIAINAADGLFSDSTQMIYLEDTYLNIIYDLRMAPYTFTSESGTFNDRFILRYTNETLSTPDEVANFGFNIIGLKDFIKVTSGNSPINTVVVYDVLGRVLADYKNVNLLEFKVQLSNQSQGTLVVKATLYNGQQKIKKVIY